MKTIIKTSLFFLAFTFFFTACSSDKGKVKEENVLAESKAVEETEPTSKELDLSFLSDVSKKSFEESAKKGCLCLNTHQSVLQTYSKEVELLIQEAEKSKKSIEEKMLLEHKKKIQQFLNCITEAGDEKDEAAGKAKEKDFLKLLGDNPLERDVINKQIEVINYYFSKNCPDGQKTFSDFLSLNERVAKIK